MVAVDVKSKLGVITPLQVNTFCGTNTFKVLVLMLTEIVAVGEEQLFPSTTDKL